MGGGFPVPVCGVSAACCVPPGAAGLSYPSLQPPSADFHCDPDCHLLK